MSGTFLSQNFLFDLEDGTTSMQDHSNRVPDHEINAQFVKSEQLSSIYFNQNLHGLHQQNDDNIRHCNNFYTDYSTRDFELGETELQNNNLFPQDHYSWSQDDHLMPSSVRSSSLYHETVHLAKQTQNNPIPHVKKGRGGRKKSTK